jgi:hypothetical protein
MNKDCAPHVPDRRDIKFFGNLPAEFTAERADLGEFEWPQEAWYCVVAKNSLSKDVSLGNRTSQDALLPERLASDKHCTTWRGSEGFSSAVCGFLIAEVHLVLGHTR